MKTVMRPLLIAVLALTCFSISKAFAGPGLPPVTEHRSSDDWRNFDHAFNDLPLFRDEEKYRVNNDRMYWSDRGSDPVMPNGGTTSAPLDGGISLLLAAGIGLGLKKMRRKTKSSHEEGTIISSADDQI